MSDADMPAAEAAPGSLRPCMEAILMVADNPVSSEQMARALDISQARADEILRGLAQSYDDEGRGFELHMTSRGWQLANRPEFENAVSAFVTDGQTARLSQAALETLAIVAYKQPITRAQITAIRGVSSDGVIRSLTVRGLIREHGEDGESHAALLVTSGLFLDKMGIRSLSELPSLAPFLPQTVSESVSAAEQERGSSV